MEAAQFLVTQMVTLPQAGTNLSPRKFLPPTPHPLPPPPPSRLLGATHLKLPTVLMHAQRSQLQLAWDWVMLVAWHSFRSSHDC